VKSSSYTSTSHLYKFVLTFILLPLLFISCEKDEPVHKATLLLKTGALYTPNNAQVRLGGTIRIGVLASGSGAPVTYLQILRIIGNDTVVQVDRGIFTEEVFDEDFTFSKDVAPSEEWRILVMNADRQTAVESIIINRAEGSDWKPIKHFPSLELSFQDNPAGNWFLDVDNGVIYTSSTVTAHEQDVDVVGYFYYTSGVPSPSLTCPGYTSAIAYYPEMQGWPVKNAVTYDYITSDNNLISPQQFDEVINDSLLVTGYKPDKVSGNCKFAYTGKVIPFKTQTGKYGMIKVEQADEDSAGIMKLSIKIQE
jgi:hypothetical protein